MLLFILLYFILKAQVIWIGTKKLVLASLFLKEIPLDVYLLLILPSKLGAYAFFND